MRCQELASRNLLPDLCKAVLEKEAAFRFKATGFSMWPFIKNGDAITIAPFQGRPAKLGEVVAFVRLNSKSMVVHRVVAKKKEGYLIKGDNVKDPDGLVSPHQILGVVTKVEREHKPIYIGLGPEKVLIGFLSKVGLLRPVITAAVRMKRFCSWIARAL